MARGSYNHSSSVVARVAMYTWTMSGCLMSSRPLQFASLFCMLQVSKSEQWTEVTYVEKH